MNTPKISTGQSEPIDLLEGLNETPASKLEGKALVPFTPAQSPPPPPPTKESSDEFDWLHDPSIVLQTQPATAVYINPMGDLVIRQEAGWDRDEDTFVLVSKQNTQQFLDSVCDLLGIGRV